MGLNPSLTTSKNSEDEIDEPQSAFHTQSYLHITPAHDSQNTH